MRLVLRRWSAARALLVSAAVTALATTTLLTAMVHYARVLPDLGTRAAMQSRPPPERSVLVSGDAGEGAAAFAARDDEIRRRFEPGLGGLPVSIAAGGYAIGQRLPDGFGRTVPGTGGTFAAVVFLDRLSEHAELVGGTWPRPVPPGQPAQVVLPERAAAALGVGVGDRVPIHDQRTDRSAPLLVVGTFRPVNPDDPYWQLAADPVATGAYGPLVVHRDEFVARYLSISTLQWILAPDLSDPGAVGPVADTVRALRSDGIPGPDGAWFPVIRTELDLLASRMDTTRVVARSGLLLPVLLVLAIAGFVLFLIARLVADQRADELWLLSARGAGRVRLAGLATVEALLVVAPAALLGAPLAGLLLRLGDRWLAERGMPSAGPGGVQAWVVAIAAAAACGAAMVIPAVHTGQTWFTERQRAARPRRWGRLQRAGADVALVVLALLAWAQLRQYAGPLAQVGGRLDIDPLLVTSPVLGVVAATALALRLLPAVTRLGVAASQRGTSNGTLLGMWHADRRPQAGPVLVVVLAVAAATLASCVAASWLLSQRDQAAQLAGADLRVVIGGSSVRLSTGDFAQPGVLAGSAAVRLRPLGGRSEIVGLDASAAPDVVRLRADLVPPGTLGALAAGRPEVPGLGLPSGTRRLTGRVSLTGDARADSSPLAAIMDDGAGTLTEVPLGRVAPAGPLAFDVPVPTTLSADARPPRLIGLTIGTSGPGVTGRLVWRWDQLRAVDGAGTAAAVRLPPEWTARSSREGPSGAPPTDLTISPDAVVLAADPPLVAFRARYVVSGLGGGGVPTPVPALVTPRLLEQSGAQVGDEVRAAEGDPSEFLARIVGTIAAVPSATSDAAMLVDLPTLDAQRLLLDGSLDRPTEWWLATDPAQHDRVAAGLAARSEFVLVDRAAVARRLLGDPLGWGVLVALYVAVLSATALAALGLVVGTRAASLRSSGELAVLHILGTPRRTLAGAFVVEQAVLAGLGVLCGLGVGLAVAAAMAPLIVLTERGGRPVPDVLLVVPPWPVAVPAIGLFGLALLLGAAIARRARRDVALGLLRMGVDR